MDEPIHSTQPADQTDRRILLLLFLVYLFCAKGYLEVWDTKASIQTAQSLISRGRLDIPAEEGVTLRAPDGRSYSKYGIGLPLYLLPYVAAGQALAHLTHRPAEEWTGFLVSFANIPWALLTVIIFGRLLRNFSVTGAPAQLLTLGLALGTLCWRYAGYDFSESMQMALLLVAVYGVFRGTSQSVVLGGLGYAGLVLVKLVHTALFAFFALYLLLRRPASGRPLREATLFTLPVLLALGFIAWLNIIRFGNALESGYGSEAHQFIPAQLGHTIPALLISLEKGLFVFCPILILGLLGWPAFIRRYPREAFLTAGLLGANLLLAGAWYSWRGGWSWGPRLLVPAIPLWLLPAAFWLDSPCRRWRFALASLVTLLSIMAQVPGVLVKDQQIHHMRDNLCTDQERPWMPADYPSAWILLRHKLLERTEVYRASEFGIPSDRQWDLTQYRTYQGLNVWTEHVARQLHKPLLRWLAVGGLLIMLYLAVRIALALGSPIRTEPRVP